ncbi:MAG: DUF3387 domain-containing protein [Betaproteobacteria bacterium]|nr:DUF3387 domain-containing protein [Betaproteobacteria bacterium]
MARHPQGPALVAHLRSLGFNPAELLGSKGFTRIKGLADAVEVVYTSDESKRRFEILARQVFIRFKALLMEPSVYAYAERHDNIEAIYKKLTERRDMADVTDLLKELHKIVNQAIQAQTLKAGERETKYYDLSKIDMEKLRDEFAGKLKRKASAIQDIRQLVEDKLAQMLAKNPKRMDYYKRYQEIVSEYNSDKDRVSIEETFAKLMALAASLDAEQRRAAEEGLSEEELAVFDLIKKETLGKAERERVKLASKGLLESLQKLLAPLQDWTGKEQTQAEVEVAIMDYLYEALPEPPFTEQDKAIAAKEVFQHVWQQGRSGEFRANT